MDVLEKMSRRFGGWYENLFPGGGDTDLRPRDILRRILATMEDRREAGLRGTVFVPNTYTLEIAVTDDEQRDYVRAFLSDAELRDALQERITERGYKTKGELTIEVREVESAEGVEPVRIRCRFDASPPIPTATSQTPIHAEEEPATVPFGANAPLAALVMRTPGRDAETFPVGGAGVKIGRSQQRGNGIVLADDTQISREHLRIAPIGGVFFAEDLETVNGTMLNGVRLPPKLPKPLSDGDVLNVGQTEFRFRLTNPQANSAVSSVFQLVLPNGNRCGVTSGVILGSAAGADIRLTGKGIADRHARFLVKDGRGHIEDLATAEGTFVNDMRLPPHFAVTLYNGNRVRLGDCDLEYVQQGGE